MSFPKCPKCNGDMVKNGDIMTCSVCGARFRVAPKAATPAPSPSAPPIKPAAAPAPAPSAAPTPSVFGDDYLSIPTQNSATAASNPLVDSKAAPVSDNDFTADDFLDDKFTAPKNDFDSFGIATPAASPTATASAPIPDFTAAPNAEPVTPAVAPSGFDFGTFGQAEAPSQDSTDEEEQPIPEKSKKERAPRPERPARHIGFLSGGNLGSALKVGGIALGVLVVLIAAIVLMVSFIGVRGTYISADNNDNFLYFTTNTLTQGVVNHDSDTGNVSSMNSYEYKAKKTGNKLVITSEAEGVNSMSIFDKDDNSLIYYNGTMYYRVGLHSPESIMNKKIKVSFDANGGNIESDYLKQTIKAGSRCTNLGALPTREGYEFVGWYSDKDNPFGKKSYCYDSESPAAIWQDVTYYAIWYAVDLEGVNLVVGGGEGAYSFAYFDAQWVDASDSGEYSIRGSDLLSKLDTKKFTYEYKTSASDIDYDEDETPEWASLNSNTVIATEDSDGRYLYLRRSCKKKHKLFSDSCVCKICGDDDHKFSGEEFECKSRVCTVCRMTEPATKPHEFAEDSYNCQDRNCVVCGTLVRATGSHSYGEAAYYGVYCRDNYCMNCGYTLAATRDHSYNNGFCSYCSECEPFSSSDVVVARNGAWYFGSYPQKLKSERVKIVDDSANSDGYYEGDDGAYYAKATAKADIVLPSGARLKEDNEYYFKVLPIMWYGNASSGRLNGYSSSVLDVSKYTISGSMELDDYLEDDLREVALNDNQDDAVVSFGLPTTQVGSPNFTDYANCKAGNVEPSYWTSVENEEGRILVYSDDDGDLTSDYVRKSSVKGMVLVSIFYLD